jgi:hypothetical protein
MSEEDQQARLLKRMEEEQRQLLSAVSPQVGNAPGTSSQAGGGASVPQNLPPQTSGLAIASLICGLLCIPLVSVVLGHIARGQINKSQGRISGAGMALAGLILGYVNLAATVVGIFIATLAIVNLGESFGAGKEGAARIWVNGTGKSYVELYFLKTRDYPDRLDDLLESNRVGESPLVTHSQMLFDPWGKQYQYEYPGEKNPNGFDLWTTTPDGRVIGNWGDW